MATTSSFKQQCPSCEAMVLIKDPKSIGKKADCPKCKYRFVVEPPRQAAADKDDEEEEKDKKKPGKSEPAAKKKGTKPAAKKAEPEEDDEDDDEGYKVKSASKKKPFPVVGVALAVLAVGLLGIGAFFVFGNKPPESPVVQRPTKGKGPTKTETDPKGKTAAKPPSAVPSKNLDVTNLLPNDTQGVVDFNFREFTGSALGRAALHTAGAFESEMVKKRLGLDPRQLHQVVLGINFERDTVFAVVRTAKQPGTIDALKEPLGLEAGPDSPINGYAYFLTPPSTFLANLGRILGEVYPVFKQDANAAAPRRLAIMQLDEETLVVADVDPMKAFLDVKCSPNKLSEQSKGQSTGVGPRVAPSKKKQPGVKGVDPNRFLTIEPRLKTMLDKLSGGSPMLTAAWNVEVIRPRQARIMEGIRGEGPVLSERLIGMLNEIDVIGTSMRMDPTGSSAGVVVGIQGKSIHFNTTVVDEVARFAGRLDAAGFSVNLNKKAVGKNRKGEAVTITSSDAKTSPVIASVSFSLSAAANDHFFRAVLQPRMMALRGLMEMAEARPSGHDLAAAARDWAEQAPEFRASFPRSSDSFRVPPPRDRVSWLVNLLPHLGYQQVHNEIRKENSWRHDPDNIRTGAAIIPAFLDRGYPIDSWRVRPHGLSSEYGATHYVGVAGVGLDAADYPADDPRFKNKLGILGHDRQTRAADIKDGLANTIFMLQVPADYKRPWISAGATVSGIPETRSIEPFVSVKHNQAPGTFALMADGSVRFVPAAIKDEVFKAMCTIDGGESAAIESAAVRINLPEAKSASPK